MNGDRVQEQPELIRNDSAEFSDALLRSAVPYWILTLLTLLLATALYFLSRYNFLLFHTLTESFFVAVAFTVYSIGWNARKFIRNNSLMLLSVSFIVIGSVQLLHFISYRDVGIFPGIPTNAATQLWVAARYLEAGAFIAAAALLNIDRTVSHWLLLGVSATTGLVLLVSIWPLDIFPDCYIDGSGLTTFKIISELVVCLLLGLAILLFWKARARLHQRVLKLLTTAILLSIVAELVFTLYVDIYGITSFLGHFFKLLSVVLIYRVLVIGTLRSPYALLFHDLHQAKEALDLELEQRRKTEMELRTANRELDAFARTVSHDLRSPLTPIIGLPDLLLMQQGDSLDERTKKALQDIRDQGRRMARILEDLLTFARAGHLLEGVAAAKIATVVDNVLEDLGSRIIASGTTVQLQGFPDVAFPRTALFQIFSNLIGNAIRYAGRAGSPIEVGGEMQGSMVVLYVRDHGPGVPVDLREKVFEVFYRGPASQEEIGSGIGLATVLKIANGLNGDVRVVETDGGGATFIVRLPQPETDRQQTLDFNIP